MASLVPPAKASIFLLKTKSTPHDGYEEYFSGQYNPTFIPVLEHRYNAENLQIVKDLFLSGSLDRHDPQRKYGGLIFTSQRAVEGFAHVIHDEVGCMFCIPFISVRSVYCCYLSFPQVILLDRGET
jgi:hypothetical protein